MLVLRDQAKTLVRIRVMLVRQCDNAVTKRIRELRSHRVAERQYDSAAELGYAIGSQCRYDYSDEQS